MVPHRLRSEAPQPRIVAVSTLKNTMKKKANSIDMNTNIDGYTQQAPSVSMVPHHLWCKTPQPRVAAVSVVNNNIDTARYM